MIRVHEDVQKLNLPVMSHPQVLAMLHKVMNDNQLQEYETTLECDFSFEIKHLA